jgi:predicted transcriptional regulator of viral defense system
MSLTGFVGGRAEVPVVSVNYSKLRQAPPDVELARLAARQHGVVTGDQLRVAGLADSAISYRLRIGRLHRVQHRVYAVGHATLSLAGRNLAAVLSVGDGGVLSHASAAAMWDLLEDRPGPVHVTVARQLRSRPGIRIHSVRHLAPRDRTYRSAIPITTVARTLLDLTDHASEHALRRAVREAQVRRYVDETELRLQVKRSRGRRQGLRLRTLVEDGPAPTRSELEDRVLELLRSHGFPPPIVNGRLTGLPRAVEVDFLFPDSRIVLEADGARYHDNRVARQADFDRQAMLEAAGYRVVRVSWQQVTQEPRQTVLRLRRAMPITP